MGPSKAERELSVSRKRLGIALPKALGRGTIHSRDVDRSLAPSRGRVDIEEKCLAVVGEVGGFDPFMR